MSIESVKFDFAVADSISRDNINEMLAEFVASVRNIGFYGIEIEEDGKGAEEAPRKKRKYTRHVKPAENPGVKVTRRKMADGTTIENRGNCQGGGAV